MTPEQILWQACGNVLGLDSSDHEFDDDIEPLFNEAVEAGMLEMLRSRSIKDTVPN